MSAKVGAITQRIPKSVSAQGACSRLEPQPKLSPATMILAWRYGPWFSTKSGFSEPSARNRTSSNRCFDKPVRLIVRRWMAGKILSVSMLIIGIGAATPVSWVNLSIHVLSTAFSDAAEVPCLLRDALLRSAPQDEGIACGIKNIPRPEEPAQQASRRTHIA